MWDIYSLQLFIENISFFVVNKYNLDKY